MLKKHLFKMTIPKLNISNYYLKYSKNFPKNYKRKLMMRKIIKKKIMIIIIKNKMVAISI